MTLSRVEGSTNQRPSLCQRGLHLRLWLNHSSTSYVCLCPPSFYGSQCQYQNERISLTIQFRTFSDSYQVPFAIVISLVDDQQLIHSYEQITYLSMSHCQTKFNVQLLYTTRPKNVTKQYRIRLDIYEKLSLNSRGHVFLPVNFPFLPVQRLAFIVDIPRVNARTSKPVHYPCNCASDSVCIGISSNNRSICVCPVHKFGLRCLLQSSICENHSTCLNDGQCIPNDGYLLSKENFTCICRKGFRGDRCEIDERKLIFSFDKDLVRSRSIFLHFIEVINKGKPQRSTTFRTIPVQRQSLTIYWSRTFHLIFIELEKKNYYLAFNKQSRTINPSDRCPHIDEVLNRTIVQWDLIRRIKYYHLPCENSLLNLSCFHDDVHLCLCYNFYERRLANCFSFDHQMKFDCFGRSVCENDGQCLQDTPTCPKQSICLCRPCFFGVRCQFTTGGFGLSLDAILGYHILPHVTLNNQPLIIQISIALTIIFIFAGFVDSILSMMTFKNKLICEVGCGLYLFGSSLTTLVTMIMFGLKFIILLLAQMNFITNRSFLSLQCHSLDYFLRICLYMDQWFNACVAIERTYTISKGVYFSKTQTKRTAKLVIIILLIVIVVSCVHDPISRTLVDEENNDNEENVKRTWCVVKYGPVLQVYDSILNTIHFFGPFFINLISSIMLITKKSRHQAALHKERSYNQILTEQLRENKHLLTAPIVLVILAVPRLIIRFVSKCLQSSNDTWIFLVGYFISFIPTMLTFIVFILPSKFYRKIFRKSFTQLRTTIQQRLTV